MIWSSLRAVRRERERLLRVARDAQSEWVRPAKDSVRLLAVAAAFDAVRASRSGTGIIEGAGTPDERDLETLLAGTDLEGALLRSGGGGFAPGYNSEEATRAVLYGVRGAAGEYWVMERLIDGDLPVPAGADRVELIDFHEPGMDLRFFSGGTEVVAANVKIAKDAAVVIRHLERYPDMALVYASSDAAAAAARAGYRLIDADASTFALNGEPVVVDIGRASYEFDAEIVSTLDALAGTGAEGVAFDPSIDLSVAVPWLSVAAITARATRRARSGAPLRVVVRGASADGVTAGVGLGTGSVVSSLGASTPLTAASSFLASVALGSIRRTRHRFTHTGDEQLAARVAIARRTLAARPKHETTP